MFQLLHELHLPTHFAELAPQLWQMYVVRSLANGMSFRWYYDEKKACNLICKLLYISSMFICKIRAGEMPHLFRRIKILGA